jgi:hypothetical protein
MALSARQKEDALRHGAFAAFVGFLAFLAIVAHARLAPPARAAAARSVMGLPGTSSAALESPRREVDRSRSPQSSPAAIRHRAGDR